MTGAVKSVGNAIGGLFGGGKQPTIVMPSPPAALPAQAPTIEDAAANRREAEDRARRRRGRAATVVTGSQGSGTPNTASKALLGE